MKNVTQILVRKIDSIGISDSQFDEFISLLNDNIIQVEYDEVYGSDLDWLIESCKSYRPEYAEFLSDARTKKADVYMVNGGYVSVYISNIMKL